MMKLINFKFLKIFKPLFSRHFIKYVIVGFFATSLDFAFLYCLVEFGHLHYLLSAIISISVILWISFTLNKFWTFGNREKNFFKQFAKYILSHAVALSISLFILTTLVEVFHFWYLFAKFFGTVVAACTNFLLVRRYIFLGSLAEKI